MSDDAAATVKAEVEAALAAGFNDEAVEKMRKRVKDLLYHIDEEIEYTLKEDMATRLADYVGQTAKRVVTAILQGNESEMRRYLSCQPNGWTGRTGDHPVIHGELFETGAVELRKQIATAHADLIRDERILDLEDQVRSLVKQVNDKQADVDRMYERVRSNA